MNCGGLLTDFAMGYGKHGLDGDLSGLYGGGAGCGDRDAEKRSHFLYFSERGGKELPEKPRNDPATAPCRHPRAQ